MKKVVLTAIAAMAMVAMVACNNNKAPEPVADDTTAATEQCDKQCHHEGDSASCCQAKVEGAADTMACCQKAEGQKCCKGEGKECPKEAAK